MSKYRFCGAVFYPIAGFKKVKNELMKLGKELEDKLPSSKLPSVIQSDKFQLNLEKNTTSDKVQYNILINNKHAGLLVFVKETEENLDES